MIISSPWRDRCGMAKTQGCADQLNSANLVRSDFLTYTRLQAPYGWQHGSCIRYCQRLQELARGEVHQLSDGWSQRMLVMRMGVVLKLLRQHFQPSSKKFSVVSLSLPSTSLNLFLRLCALVQIASQSGGMLQLQHGDRDVYIPAYIHWLHITNKLYMLVDTIATEVTNQKLQLE